MRNFNNKNINRVKTKAKKTKKVDKDRNIDLEFILYLERLGCSIVDLGKDTSLLLDNKDKILNPNIQSKNISKNKKQKTDKSFPNESDPFYDVGEELPQSKSSEAASQKIKDNSAKIKLLAVDLDLL